MKWFVLCTCLVAITVTGIVGCSGGSGSNDNLFSPDLGTVVPLTAADVQLIISRAVAALSSTDVHVAVVDRTGAILGVFSTAGGVLQDEDNIAVSLARTTGFFSNSQAPLSSRTVQTISTFHFPPTFSAAFLPSVCPQSGVAVCPNTVIAPQLTTTGVAGTPEGPLWQINATNRGAPIESSLTVPPTFFNAGQAFPPSRNIDGTFPSPGITLLPGAVPLYKTNVEGTSQRLVGGIGVYVGPASVPDPDILAGEYAAITGAAGTGAPGDENFFLAIPPVGLVYLGGILLPYVAQIGIPAGYVAGTIPPPPPAAGWLVPPVPGSQDPFGFLIGPRASPDAGGLSLAEVNQIIQQCVDTADGTRAAIRLPLGSTARIIAVVTDRRGLILAHFRMADALTDAVDVVPAKARTTVYYSRPGGPDPADQWPGFPVDPVNGVAITTRTLGFLSQPFFPPGIETSGVVGPLFARALDNQLPAQATRLGAEPPDPDYQNGLIFFPGSVPLYRNGVLVGGLGVSGDGVEQNDFIAAGGGAGFEPPAAIRIDNFSFQGLSLPYLKFPLNPGPGNR